MSVANHVNTLKDKLYCSTILAHYQVTNVLPETIINFFRSIVDPSDENPVLQKIKDPYEYAKERLNSLWSPPEIKDGQSPVAQLTTARGALASYWIAEKWKGRMQSAGLNTLSVVNGLLPAGLAIQGADMMTTLTNTGLSEDFGMAFGKTLALYGTWAVSRLSATKLAKNLSADVARHVQGKFAEAAEARPDIFKEIAQADLEAEDDQSASLGHTMFTAPKEFAEASILRRSGLLNLGVSAAALGTVLYQNSVPIEVLDQLAEHINAWVPGGNMDFAPGEKGTFVAALTATGLYSAFTSVKGRVLGQMEERTQERKDIYDSNLRDNLTKTFLAQGSDTKTLETYQEELNESHERAKQHINSELKHSTFKEATGWFNFPFSFVPSGLSIFSPKEGFKALNNETTSAFWTNQTATLLFLDNISEAVNIMSSRGSMAVPRKHITELANKIEEAWQAAAIDPNAQNQDTDIADNLEEEIAILLEDLPVPTSTEEEHIPDPTYH